MKKITKNISIILTILIMLLGSIIFPKPSIAAGETAELYGTHSFSNLLTRNGMNINCIYIVYEKDGVEYPTYCMDLELDGATEDYSYKVNIDNLITDMEIWRTVVNGYPYKTLEELGCETKEEAYLATKQAVYCALYDRDPNTYKAAPNAAGERTLKALKQIVNAARTSTETKPSATLNIVSDNTKWEIDNNDLNYVSKEFTVTASAGIRNYEVKLTGTVIEGTKIVDSNNIEKTQFADGEKFKILIPIKNIKQDGNFTINVGGDVATKPIIFGKSTISYLQDAALTGSIYEDGSGVKTEYYFKNETKIEILKQNQKTKAPLENVKFQILDENKQVIYSDLVTDKDGKIIVENLLPGKYYIQEMETLEGYEVYEKLIEIDAKLNEEVKVTVNNLHKNDIPTVEKTNTELEVEQVKSETKVEQNKEIIKLPKTGM